MFWVSPFIDWNRFDVVRLLPDGGLDTSWGGGNGRATVEPDQRLPGNLSTFVVGTTGIVASSDGRFVYLGLRVVGQNAIRTSIYGFSMARLSAGGELDPAFGREGMSLLTYGHGQGSNFVLDRNDRPLVLASERVIRLLNDDGSSPGLLANNQALNGFEVPESVGTARLTVSRFAGSSGAISARVIVRLPDEIDSEGMAIEGQDYTLRTNRLDWADGDETDKSILIDIVDDTKQEKPEWVMLELVDATSGAYPGFCGRGMT
jgi:hypothetical protein